jgi:5-(carboxyamino)imidazole ribonucleotide mutase
MTSIGFHGGWVDVSENEETKEGNLVTSGRCGLFQVIFPALSARPDKPCIDAAGAGRQSPRMDSPQAADVGIIMGSTSDWPTMEHAARTLRDFGVTWEAEVVSAHRTPDKLFAYASAARERGLRCLIAGAGGAAHLPGMAAAITDLPVLGVPVESKALHGVDSLLSIVQMPAGIPTATFAIGRAGAVNAALFAIAMLAHDRPELAARLAEFRRQQNETVRKASLPPLA